MYYLRLFVDLNPDKKLQNIDELERIDYRNISIIENVIEGQIIGEAISVDTLDDKDKEQVTKLKSVDEIKNYIGEGVYIKENEPSRIYAQKSGQIIFQDGKFHIKDKLELNDVSYKTGNVTFVGDLYIKGDIKSGFKVSARNLFVEGSVDNAQLIAGERVIVKGGVIGLQNKDFCIVKAGKLVVLNFIENSTIECNGPVYIKKSAMHTNIYADGRIVVFGEPGLVVGGEILARNNLLVRVAGSKWGTPTILKVGIDPFKYLRLKNYEKKLENSTKLLEDVNKSIEYVNSVLEQAKDESEDREKLENELKEIENKKEKYEKHIERLKKVIEKLKIKIEEEKEKFHLEDTKIYVFEKIFPGVELRVGLEHHKIYEDMNASIISIDNNGNVNFSSIK